MLASPSVANYNTYLKNEAMVGIKAKNDIKLCNNNI